MNLRPLAVAILALATAACGTTVSSGSASSDELSAPNPAAASAGAAGSAGTVAGTTPGGASGATGSSVGAAPAAGAAAQVPSTVAGQSTPAIGSSAPHAPIEVGIGVDGNNGPFAAAFGVSNSQPAERDIAASIVAYINHHGGLAGHPIRPVYAVFDNTSSDWVSQDQAICAQFTQDHHVAVAVRNDDIFGPLDSCLAQAHTPLILWESVFRQPSWYAAAPGLRFGPDDGTGDRIYRSLVARMVATHRWTRTTKIGLVRYDRADQSAVQSQAVEPALAHYGLKLTDAEAVHTPESFQDLGTTSSDLAGAVLRMRQRGITNVVFMGGDIAYLFAQEAISQKYYPAYALTSWDFPNLLPPAALRNAFGIGWDPTDDLIGGWPTTTGVKRCQRAAAGRGVNWHATGVDRFYVTCDQLFFLQAAFDAAGSVTPGSLATGAHLLGSSLAASYTMGINAAQHPDGLAAYRDLSYVSSCSCLRYGPQFAMP